MQPSEPPAAAPPPSAPSPRAAEPARRLTLALGLAWVGLHVAGLAARGFAVASESVWTWGAPDPEAVLRHGGFTPALLEAGELQRLLTGPGYLGPGVLSVLLGLWIGLSSLAFLERRVGWARLLTTLVSGAVVGGLVRSRLNAGSPLLHSTGWDLILAAVGARIPYGLRLGGTAGRAAVSGALAFAALSVALVYATNAGNLEPLRGQGAAFAAGALTLGLWGGGAQAPGPAARSLGSLALVAVLTAVGVQTAQAFSAPARGPLTALLERLAAAEHAAATLWREQRDPASIPPAERAALGERLDALLAEPALSGLAGEAELRALAESLRPLATGDLRDPGGVLARARRAAAAWIPLERRLRAQAGLGEPPRAPWR